MDDHLFTGPNAAYVEEQYEIYKRDPGSVEGSLQRYFDQYQQTRTADSHESRTDNGLHKDTNIKAALDGVNKLRAYGHLFAQLDPLHLAKTSHTLNNEVKDLLDQGELFRKFRAQDIWKYAPSTVTSAEDAYKQLTDMYTGTIAYEFLHVHDLAEREWLYQKVEKQIGPIQYSTEEKKQLFYRLSEVEEFEHFLQKTFVGQKRFSIEGLEAMVPMLDLIIKLSMEKGICNIMMGMSHRGRLNVLAHVLGKPYEAIFSEFHHSPNKDLVPSEGSMGLNEGWTGDVKYHLGANRKLSKRESPSCSLRLANNPSHLEFVNPVVLGLTRAAQENVNTSGKPQQDLEKALSIIIHGDAAFPGEGVVSETLNLTNTPAYHTGGSIHIIANNRIGFTTEHEEARSTHYASDIAKGYEIPIVHVNADDPEACLSAVLLAFQYRQKFHKDFLIDLIGYRRYGHNEMDDPAATQPTRYDLIDKHPTVKQQYEEILRKEGTISEKWNTQTNEDILKKLKKSYEIIQKHESDSEEVSEYPEIEETSWPKDEIDTRVDMEALQSYLKQSLTFPTSFNVYRKLKRILDRRSDALEKGNAVDWATSEMLAFASILADGTPIRMSGQDTQRGTFGQRHLAMFDSKTGEAYYPLHNLKEAKASFSIHNSPLSEAAVVGFEYGYNVFSKDTMVIWEAQYGDFVNAAQVIIDQFISAGRAKWGEVSSLIMLLPHGYEGQGPEHSSARLERFLQLCAEQNMVVAYPSTSAQYFHILRRHAELIKSNQSRPLILMTPKSLLRHEKTASEGKSLSEGSFKPIWVSSQKTKKDKVTRIICCTGKVAIDAEDYIQDQDEDTQSQIAECIQIIRIEQLYPFPKDEILKYIEAYKNLEELVWLQEEPSNMGAWRFFKEKMDDLSLSVPVYRSSRPRRSSPAGGNPKIHRKEQLEIVENAFDLSRFNHS